MFCRNCGNKLKEGDKFCASCGQKIEEEEENSQLVTTKEQAIVDTTNNSSNNKEEINKLINYLRNAIILEKRKFALEETIDKLEDRIDGYSKKSKKKEAEKARDTENMVGVYVDEIFETIRFMFVSSMPMLIVWMVIDVVIMIVFSMVKYKEFYANSVTNEETTKITIIGFVIIVPIWVFLIVNRFVNDIKMSVDSNKKIIAENKQKEIDFNNFNKEVERYNEEMDRKTEEDNIKLSFVKDKLKETEKILEDLYSLKFIHKKYQNFIAVVTICEYFETGRCSTLEGYIGAYNIFEQESLQKTIISRLDDVLDSLDEIKGNQYAVYCAIQQGNAMSSQLFANMNNISSDLNNGLKSLNESARYTKENTEILKYLELTR